MYQVPVNATVQNKRLWSKPNGLAARAYGIVLCLTPYEMLRYTPIRWEN